MKTTLFLVKKPAIFFFLMLLFLLFTSSGYGQNLIKNTQAGILPKSTETLAPNRVANWINSKKETAIPTNLNLFQLEKKKNKSFDFQSDVKKATYLTLDQDLLTQFVVDQPEMIAFTIPVAKNKSFQLELVKVENVADDFTLKTSDGKTLTQKEIGGIFYRGIVKDDVRSIAALSVFPDHLQLIVSDRSDNYVLAALPDQDAENGYVLYAEKDLIGREKAQCLLDMEGKEVQMVDKRKPSTFRKSGEDRCLQVYIECDFSLFIDTGNDAVATAQYVQSVFNVSATIYQNEGINKEINEIFVWTQRDPFRSSNFSGAVLNEFILSKASTGFNGNYAHFLTTRLGSQGIAASFDCDFPFALTGFLVDLSDAFPTPSFDVYIFAHEMGHNMGSLHTHGCYWNSDTYGTGTQIDDCGNANRLEVAASPEGTFCQEDVFNPILPEEGGTIMSYCTQGSRSRAYPGVNFELGFGAQPGDIIRRSYNNPPRGCRNFDALEANLNCTAIDSIARVGNRLEVFGIRVENQGAVAVEASNIGLYLSLDQVVSPGLITAPLETRNEDFLITVVPVGTLEAGESILVDAAIDLSAPDLIAGQYFLGAYANYDRLVDESNLGDNGIVHTEESVTLNAVLSCVDPINVQIEGTELILSDLAIQNSGDHTAAFVAFDLYLSEDSLISSLEDQFITSISISSLTPDSIVLINERIDLKDYSLPAGNYFLGATANASGTSIEEDSGCTFELLEYTVGEEDQLCRDEIYTAATGTVTDGSGSANAQFGTLCRRTIIPDVGGRIELDFTELDIVTARDFVVFYEGSNFNNLIGAFTGDVVPDSTITARDQMQILYIGLNESAGWSADYRVSKFNVDAELSIRASNTLPRPFQKVKYTFEVVNNGFRPLTNVVVQQNSANGNLRLADDSQPIASPGRYLSATGTWTIPLLPPSRTATLELEMIALTEDFELFAEIITMAQTDGDSSPNNGVCCIALEDDEAVFSPNVVEPDEEEEVSIRMANVSETNLRIQGLFPNPVQSMTTLLFSGEAQSIYLSIQDVNGKVVHQENWRSGEGLNYKQLDLSHLGSGIYFLTMNGGLVERLVKVK